MQYDVDASKEAQKAECFHNALASTMPLLPRGPVTMMPSSLTRKIGDTRSKDGRFARVVKKMVIHDQLLDFRELCRRSVPTDTRYLVLDLDRTTHLGRNLGELLGWELVACKVYGIAFLESIQNTRPPGRMFLDWHRPLDALRYIGLGARMWAVPGLCYLVWGKLAARMGTLRRWTYLRFGQEPVSIVQRVPQTALMHYLTALPLETSRRLAAMIWERHAADQVIEREDMDWLRTRCPNIRIIISSASPRPVLEVAREKLGVDDILYSSLEEQNGYLSAPPSLLRLSRGGPPRRISPLRDQRVNSSYAKLEHLLERFPDLCDPAVVTVGITDTGYGEDHCWAQYLTRVVDINSNAPFSPVIAADSPLEEIHSAAVLTRGERACRAAGDGAHQDPRRQRMFAGVTRTFTAEQLEPALGPMLDRIEVLGSRYHAQRHRLSASLNGMAEMFRAMDLRLEAAVAAYNDASERERERALRTLEAYLARSKALFRQRVTLARPLSELSFALATLLESSREALWRMETGDAR